MKMIKKSTESAKVNGKEKATAVDSGDRPPAKPGRPETQPPSLSESRSSHSAKSGVRFNVAKTKKQNFKNYNLNDFRDLDMLPK